MGSAFHAGGGPRRLILSADIPVRQSYQGYQADPTAYRLSAGLPAGP
jgi:hypothetical protein